MWLWADAYLLRVLEKQHFIRFIRVIQQPFPAGFLFVGLIYLWLIPFVHFSVMLNTRLYSLMDWTMVVDGILFWCLILDPRPAPMASSSFMARIILSLAVIVPQALLGLFLAMSPNDLYRSFDLCGRLYANLKALTDQHIGGLIIAIPASMMSAVACVIILNRMLELSSSADNQVCTFRSDETYRSKDS